MFTCIDSSLIQRNGYVSDIGTELVSDRWKVVPRFDLGLNNRFYLTYVFCGCDVAISAVLR